MTPSLSRRCSLVLSAGLAAVLLVLGAPPPAEAGAMIPIAGDPVFTQGGQVAGTRLDSGVKAYLGIPFAKPPTQNLRWRPPEPIHWQGVWNADHKAPECIQVLRPHNINHYFGEEATSEDCLYLNVWTPPKATAASKLPVIVFIYGGGFTIGSSGSALYDGEALAKRGAVFVNLNYRLGLLGFMAHPELTKEQGGHSGDYALMDQSAALHWVHDNIAQFGGDPSKVIIMGQSAGASSVAAQIFSPLSRGLFRGAVMSSVCNYSDSTALMKAGDLASGEQVGLQVQQRLGAADLAQLRLIPADKLLALQAESQVGVNQQGVRAGPIIDGYFMPKSKLAALQAHEAADVPIIASSNHEDLDAGSPLARVKTVAEYQALAAQLYGGDAAQFLQLYPASTDADVYQAGMKAAREQGLEASSRTCAQLQARYNSSPTYIDLYAHTHPYAPGVKIADQDPATAGGYHTADIPYWFDTLDKFNLFRPTRAPQPWDRELIDRMSGALIAFAETGNPSTPAMPWPAWSAGHEQKLVIDDRTHMVDIDVRAMDWLAAHPAAALPPAPARVGPRD
ncbi:MAG TPA: carboxylesterase family protein [Caulobacteraceae bacterium]|nr:carboxylesterase family protein [Caulobacteraceae bacterium]